MTPRIPKISVRPDATRNSSRPYWMPFRTWMAMNESMVRRPRASSDRASGGGIGDRLLRDCDDDVVAVPHLADIDVLHRIARLGERPAPARAVELDRLHRGEQLRRRPGIAPHLVHGAEQQLGSVVAL